MASLTGIFRVGNQPELRSTPSGKQVTNLSLAYNYGMKGQDGFKPSQWVEAVAWEKSAEILQQYVSKGDQLFAVLDDVHIATYEKRDGGTGTKLTARISGFEFVKNKDSGEQKPQAPKPAAAPAPRAASGFEDMSDDIPFADPMASRAFCMAVQ